MIHSHSQQPLSAALLSTAILSSSSQHSHSQQLFSAQPFSAAILSSHSLQAFSAAILSSSSQQPFSAATLSSSSQQLFSAAIISRSSQQPVSADTHYQQPLSAAILSYHLAVVRGWWSAIVISDYHHVAVVRGWWSAIISSCCCCQGLVVSYLIIILLWSVVGGQLRTRSLEKDPFAELSGKKHGAFNWRIWLNGFSSCSARDMLVSGNAASVCNKLNDLELTPPPGHITLFQGEISKSQNLLWEPRHSQLTQPISQVRSRRKSLRGHCLFPTPKSRSQHNPSAFEMAEEGWAGGWPWEARPRPGGGGRGGFVLDSAWAWGWLLLGRLGAVLPYWASSGGCRDIKSWMTALTVQTPSAPCAAYMAKIGKMT